MTPPIERPGCLEALDWLQRQLDGSAKSMPASVADHAKTCADCQGRIRAADLLQAALTDKPKLIRFPSERIVLAVQRDHRKQKAIRWFGVAASLAAALVLAAWLMNRPAAGPQMVQAPLLRDAAGDAGNAVVAIGKRAASETLGESRLLVPKVDLPPVAVTALASAAAPINDAGKGLLDGLEPMASSARRAIGMFVRDGGSKNN